MEAGHRMDELIDERKGSHPSALLYHHVVEAMLPVVEELLGETQPAAS